MWELQVSTSHKRFYSVRSILAYVLATFIAALLFITASPQEVHAADASWNGASITHSGNQYTGPAAEQTVAALKLPKDTKVYTFVEPSTASNRKMHIIYFAPGTDPGTVTAANYRTYSYNGQNSFTNPSSAVAIALEPQTTNAGTNSCDVDGGLGWIICPVTNTLATWMDWVFSVLAGFLEVRPIQTGEENALYRAWTYMRTFANIAFVVAFLVIIYSQLTSFGVSNYGIKKLLPRIIIAAILVNMSYIICSIAIDISNVLGFSIQNIFIGMRNTLVGAEGNSWDALSWESVSSFVLSGGSLAVGASIGILSAVSAYGGAAAAALAILLPALVILIIAVLVALLIMAARQAIITILTILAPLAFVAYLLPNTEKWFDKWRSVFMTMLILFPAFSVIFGGSQLAGAIIIQNADSINLILLGMIVQVAPLFVTPLLIKFSGSLLGRIAGIVNNPNRGIIDRTRNFAKDRAENMKARNLQAPAKSWQLDKKMAQRFDHNRRRREGWRNANTAMADANWANSGSFRAIDQMSREAGDRKTLGETLSAEAYNKAKLSDVSIRQLDVDVRQAKLNLDNAELKAGNENWEKNHTAPVVTSKLQQRVLKDTEAALHAIHDSEYNEFKTGKKLHAPNTVENLLLQQEAMRNADILSANALRKASAERVLTDQFTKKLEADNEVIDGKTIRGYAGGIDPNGAQRALAAAFSAQSKAFNENIDNAGAILTNKNISNFDSVDIALGKNAAGIKASEEMQLAAIRKITKSGDAGAIGRFLESFDVNGAGVTQDMRQEVADNLITNGARPKWYGAGMLASIKSGTGVPAAGRARTDELILKTYNEGKLSSADTLVTQDKDHVAQFAETFKRRKADFARDPAQLAKLKEHLGYTLNDPRFSGRAGERTKYLEEIYNDIP